MKNLKLFTLSILIASLASCKLEESIIGNQAQSKNDNSMSKNDDSMYEFNTKQYYNDGKLLSDTVQIKNLLHDAQVVYEDTTGRRTIFDSEAKYVNYVGGSKQSESTDDLAKTELVYNTDNGNYSINGTYSDWDPRLLIYGFVSTYTYYTYKHKGENHLECYFIGGPCDMQAYEKPLPGFIFINTTTRVHKNNVTYTLENLIDDGMYSYNSKLKFFACNPTPYKKRLTVILRYYDSSSGKVFINKLVADVKSKKTWYVTGRLISDSEQIPRPFTGGLKGQIVQHYSE